MKRIAQVEKAFMRKKVPQFGPGDTVRVHVKIKEGDKERIQVFQGNVVSRRGGGTGETFTVRKISSGIGVERIFPLHSPNIAKIERLRVGDVRRAKLYYLRDLTGKSARIRETLLAEASQDEPTEAADTAPEEKTGAEPAEVKAEETGTAQKPE